MTDIGAPDRPLRFVGEELQLDVFSGTDPADTGAHRWWYRDDLSVNESDAVIRVNNNGTIVDVPVFEESATVEDGIETTFGVVAPGLAEPAFVPLAVPEDAAFDFARVETPAGQELAMHDRLAPGSAIPDSEGLHAHYAARLLTGYSDGETVDPFVDDNGSNDAPATGQPTYRENRINGQPTVEYDGANDYHDTGIVPDTTQPRSVYVVWIVSDDGSNTAYSALDQSGTADRFYNAYVGSGGVRLGYGDTTNNGGSYPINDFNISTNVYGAGSGEAWIDSTSQHTFNYTGVNDMATSIYIGGRNTDDSLGVPLSGEIAEIVDYQADHDSQTRQKVWDYLNNIYGVF